MSINSVTFATLFELFYIYDANYRKIVNKTAQTCENNELMNAFSQ
jgi:hypothetical protein